MGWSSLGSRGCRWGRCVVKGRQGSVFTKDLDMCTAHGAVAGVELS